MVPRRIYWPVMPHSRIEWADLSASRATIESSGSIYWPSVPSRRVFRQIYRPTAAKGLIVCSTMLITQIYCKANLLKKIVVYSSDLLMYHIYLHVSRLKYKATCTKLCQKRNKNNTILIGDPCSLKSGDNNLVMELCMSQVKTRKNFLEKLKPGHMIS